MVDSKLGFPLQHLPTLLKEADEALRTATKVDEKARTSKIMVLLKPDHYTALNIRYNKVGLQSSFKDDHDINIL